MTREIIEIVDEESWLQERAKDLTSTSISGLFDLSPYCTVFELYHAHKNGIILPFRENDRTIKGKMMEQYAAEVVMEKLGAVAVRRLNIYARIPGERFGSSFDFELEFSCGEKVLLEIKALDYFRHKEKWVDGEAPEHIEIQLQHQLEAIDRYDRGIIAAFTSIYDFVPYERERDREMGQSLRTAAKKFWDDVEAGNEPSPNFYRDDRVIAELYKNAAGEAADMSADTELEILLARYERQKADANTFEKEAKATKAEIHSILGNHAAAFTENKKVVAKWTKGAAGTLVTAAMVGTRVNAKAGYRQLLIYNTGGNDE